MSPSLPGSIFFTLLTLILFLDLSIYFFIIKAQKKLSLTISVGNYSSSVALLSSIHLWKIRVGASIYPEHLYYIMNGNNLGRKL